MCVVFLDLNKAFDKYRMTNSGEIDDLQVIHTLYIGFKIIYLRDNSMSLLMETPLLYHLRCLVCYKALF